MLSGTEQTPFKQKQAFGLLAVSLLARCFFWFQGYGVEEDSWGSVVAAHNTWETGIPEVSRLPGHPVYESILILLYKISSPALYNACSSLFALVSIWFFLKLLHALGIKNYIQAGYGLSFSPLFFICSTYTIDYVYALGFALGTGYYLDRKKILAAGILMGLSIGCRINSLALIPVWFFLPLLSGHSYKFITDFHYLKHISVFVLLSCLVAALCYLPVAWIYGSAFWDYSDQFPYPSFAKVFYKAGFGAWGIPGLIGLLWMMVITIPSKSMWWWILSITQIGMYLLLPQKSAYLLPWVVFSFLFAATTLKAEIQKWFWSLQILSSLILYVGLGDEQRGSKPVLSVFETNINGQKVFLDLFSGPVYGDYSKRKNKLIYTASVRAILDQQKDSLAIISGWWYNQLLAESYASPLPKNVLPVFYCSCDSLQKLQRLGYRIKYLPEQNTYNNLMFGDSCTEKMAEAFQE
ncbi:MAG: hypothetical protein ACK5CV_02325 [Bacteroidota bacterium]|jgi:hypothetical protein